MTSLQRESQFGKLSDKNYYSDYNIKSAIKPNLNQNKPISYQSFTDKNKDKLLNDFIKNWDFLIYQNSFMEQFEKIMNFISDNQVLTIWEKILSNTNAEILVNIINNINTCKYIATLVKKTTSHNIQLKIISFVESNLMLIYDNISGSDFIIVLLKTFDDHFLAISNFLKLKIELFYSCFYGVNILACMIEKIADKSMLDEERHLVELTTPIIDKLLLNKHGVFLVNKMIRQLSSFCLVKLSYFIAEKIHVYTKICKMSIGLFHVIINSKIEDLQVSIYLLIK